MKKYKDLYEVEKQRFEETLQRYQENHIDEVEIISLHKRCNKTRTKAKPVVKQSLELIETDPGHSYLEINLRHIVFDSIEASVGLEGTYRGKKISYVGTCNNGDCTKIMTSSKVDEQIKETIEEL